MLLFHFYVYCTSDYSLIWIYILRKHSTQRLLFLYFSHHFLHTFTQLVEHHRGTIEPPSFKTLAQPPSYFRGGIWSCPLIGTSFTHSYECYYLSINFASFYITWVNFPRSSIHSLSFTQKQRTHFLSRREHQPT
jgi:hypothetical protein